MSDLRRQLQDRFGLDDFRPAQREVIEDVLAGRDVLCVMPTGAGKSLCYQLPATIQGGLTIVVSPLISLMEDQVQQLRDEGISAAMLNSSMTAAMQREATAQIESGFEGLLYVAPERFFAPNFQHLLPKLNVKLLAIDEAHCISQWGHDFRPEYSQLGQIREKLGTPTTIALTATATEDVRNDIIHGLSLREPSITITGFDRPNLSYQCRRISKVAEKDAEVTRLLRNEPGSAIVYCSTRRAVDELTEMLSRQFPSRTVTAYHAGMNASDRTGNQEKFMQTPHAIAVATNAFGMGINKPDVRLIVHYNLPGTLEAYYQEAGRAGRDGQPARCVLIFSYQDRMTQEFFIKKIGQDHEGADPRLIEKLKQRAGDKLELMIRYGQRHTCRRKQILEYFGDEAEVFDCNCDICAPDANSTIAAPIAAVSEQVTTTVRQLLSGVARLNGKFGIGAVAEVLAGAENERMLKWDFYQLSVYGLLKSHPIKRVIAMLHRLVESGLARQKSLDLDQPRFVVELTAAGIDVMKGTQPPPTSLSDLIPSSSRAAASSRSSGKLESNDPLDDDAQDRFERLRNIRIEFATQQQLPPYCICHDSTLKLIAKFVPDTLEKLEQIKGMGPYKVKMYGEKFLEAIKT